MLKKITMMALSAASAFAMHSAQININEADLEIGARFDMGQFNQNVEPDTMFVGAKFLNADAKHSSDSNVTLDPYLELNFLMQREIANSGVRFGLGVKLNYTKDYSTAPLGLEFAYTIPAPKLIPMHVNGSVYYAPSALAFSDAKDFVEYHISYDIEIIDNGAITVGYRSLNTNYNYDNNDMRNFSYNKSWYAGFKFAF
jgi:hypothetical protein